jgi:hypothetical protein
MECLVSSAWLTNALLLGITRAIHEVEQQGLDLKISKLFPAFAALTIATSLLSAAPANADCYWGSDGVLVVDSTGQCTISVGPPFVDPNAGSTPAPSPSQSAEMPSTPVVEVTPIPTATPTPISAPVPTPTSTAKPKLVSHSVIAIPGSINSFPMKRIQITDLDDSNYSTVCYYSFTCELELPAGHKWSYSIISDYDFGAAMNGIADWFYGFPVPEKIFDNYVVNRTLTTSTPTQVWYRYRASPFLLTAQTDKTQTFGFDLFGKSTGTPIKVEQGQLVNITQSIKTLKKVNWANLPAGLVEAPDGTISGRPTASGVFAVEAKFGPNTSVDTYKFTIEVAPGLIAPKELKSARTDLTSANLSFSTEASTNSNSVADFFEIELKNMRTSTVVLKYFEGSSRAGIFRDLLPGDAYKIRMRSAKSNPLRYSGYSEEIDLKPQAPTQYFASNKGALKLTQTWLEGSSTSIALTYPATVGGQIQSRLPRASKMSVTKAQAKAFGDYYPGLFMTNAGEITGSVTKADIALKPYTLKIGTITFVFRFSK